ncbi:MAG: hypothetical protein CVV51_03180 [Spirochaetae bacterium HGW-Spirochaetae-7]|nr:MAG: hypothetical protein CVV51_03180 [Spirochaetae bacterium HGW-Spirochaetae-7]
MKAVKAPRFFCEHCGAEVGRDERACPECGRFFSAVRCPRCEFSGSAEKFAHGCPVCGYSMPSIDRAYGRPSAVPNRAPAPLPLWVWLVALSALGAAVWALLTTM